MSHRAGTIAAALLLALLAAPAAVAVPAASDADYHMHVDVNTTPRMGEDAGTAWLALPEGKVKVLAGGRTRRVYARGFTVCCDSATTAIKRIDSGAMAMVERPLRAKERRRFGSKLAWIDGDVLIAHPSNPACTEGLSLSRVRAILKGDEEKFARVYAPASGFNGNRELMFGLFSDRTDVRVYGSKIRLVREGSAISSVASSTDAAAAVAWSAAREELAAGTVCGVPVDGKTADEASLRARTYSAWVHAHLVYRKSVYAGWKKYVRKWFSAYVSGKRVRDTLRSARGRDVLAP